VGEVFNVAAPKSTLYPAAAEVLAEATGKDVLQWRAPVRWVFDLDITKARSWIGYEPQWTIERMIAGAVSLDANRGEQT